ncbi:MAG TPA: MauE/DoxX family redox-associated membrane protein [Anaerolineales bacterium]|nr:MauE/DoxX family redox-associated membrane protein [Anaerolineales bacterium]
MTDQREISIFFHLAFAFQISLGIVFLLSVLPKVRGPLTFAQSVVEYQILPAKVAYAFALALIPLEALLAASFLTGWLTDFALPVAAMMLITFLIAVGINLRRGRRISCGCFGNSNEQISSRTSARLLLLLATVLFLIIFGSTQSTPLPNLGMMMTNPLMFTFFVLTAILAVFLLLLAIWILSLPDLVFLVRHFRKGT